MPQIKVSLSIGFAGAGHEDILDIDDVEWDTCETEEQRNDLLEEYWKEWAWDYIDSGWELIEEEG